MEKRSSLLNNQVNAEDSSDLPPPYIPSEVVHCQEHRHHLPLRERPPSIFSSTVQNDRAYSMRAYSMTRPELVVTWVRLLLLPPTCECGTSGRARIADNTRTWNSVESALPCSSPHVTSRFLALLTGPVCFFKAHAHIPRELTFSPAAA